MSKRVALLLAVLSLVASCGYRGALYLPEDQAAQPTATTDQETPEPSAEEL